MLTTSEKVFLKDSLKDIKNAVSMLKIREYSRNRVEVIVEIKIGSELYDMTLPNNTFDFNGLKKQGNYSIDQLGLFKEDRK